MSVGPGRFGRMVHSVERFHVAMDVHDHVVELRPVGEIDIATVTAFRAALWAAPARPVLRVDLSGVRLLSAAGVRALVATHLRVRARGGELVLVDPDPVVARVLRVTGLHRVLPVRCSDRSQDVPSRAHDRSGRTHEMVACAA
ncbi:anti-sigma factor antagonist [Micromonospora chalcea]|uniref:Anti-sigma factor antagonist n=2 Tax=Micromonosporaceae TaxID=28056 RepID=A0ABX9XYH9_MICCH|nr:STAS domain-containing protein [Micromonospora chalcea]MBQ1062857.1 STAS domain-containing protein [Micromonospora sp. C41]MBQ1070325.1 STAS domain-containing protein [Micromonospora sp. D75]MDH6472345.1 anti-sigma B factor antagonist [Micromonospora sp. H404/HB375]ODB79025.1 anti-anti-sigma factor [Micromonospora sp. II]RBQ09304.1 anti-sigma factor antagonist [Micromonospora sp. LHW51205]